MTHGDAPGSDVPDPEAELVRQNLIKFRSDAGLSRDHAADLAGIHPKALQRWEDGATTDIPGRKLRALAHVYGHEHDHFYLPHPPPPDLAARPVFYLRTLDGVPIDQDTYRMILGHVAEANRIAREQRRAAMGLAPDDESSDDELDQSGDRDDDTAG